LLFQDVLFHGILPNIKENHARQNDGERKTANEKRYL